MSLLVKTFDEGAQQLIHGWLASREFWQSKWSKLLDITGDDPENLWIWGTSIVTILWYWGIGSLYIFLDVTNRPKFLRKYKIQPGTNEPIDKKKIISSYSTSVN